MLAHTKTSTTLTGTYLFAFLFVVSRARRSDGWRAVAVRSSRIRVERVDARSQISRNEPLSHLGECVDARDVVSGDYTTVSDDKRFVSFGFARGRRGGTARRRTGADRMMGTRRFGRRF